VGRAKGKKIKKSVDKGGRLLLYKKSRLQGVLDRDLKEVRQYLVR
jgi:hypothetical protein